MPVLWLSVDARLISFTRCSSDIYRHLMRGGRSFATEGTEITLEILGAAKYCHAPPPLGVVIEREIKSIIYTSETAVVSTYLCVTAPNSLI